ncbi:MAG: tyrosine-type recombinase/integrase [Gemmatimonadales bacterium]
MFATLAYTGLRVGEAQGLCWSDVRLSEQLIIVHDKTRRLKTSASASVVPIPLPLARVRAENRTPYPGGPADPVFPHPLGSYQLAQRIFQRACREAGLHDVRIHDLRHTFGVHCAQAGIPIVRLQKLIRAFHSHHDAALHESMRQRITLLRTQPELRQPVGCQRSRSSGTSAALAAGTEARLVLREYVPPTLPPVTER